MPDLRFQLPVDPLTCRITPDQNPGHELRSAIDAEDLVDLVMDVCCLVSDDESEGVGKKDNGRHPEDPRVQIPRPVVGVRQGHRLVVEANVQKVETLGELEVVVNPLVFLEELGALLAVRFFRQGAGERELARESYLRRRVFFEVDESFGGVDDPEVGVVEDGSRHLRVDSFVEDLRRSIGVASPVAHHLQRETDGICSEGRRFTSLKERQVEHNRRQDSTREKRR